MDTGCENLGEVVGASSSYQVAIRALGVLLVVGRDMKGDIGIAVANPVESHAVEAVRRGLYFLKLLLDLGYRIGEGFEEIWVIWLALQNWGFSD